MDDMGPCARRHDALMRPVPPFRLDERFSSNLPSSCHRLIWVPVTNGQVGLSGSDVVDFNHNSYSDFVRTSLVSCLFPLVFSCSPALSVVSVTATVPSFATLSLESSGADIGGPARLSRASFHIPWY